ncbi:MAG: SwmB domain-containing protein [Candidatus Limnocylindrales bacterium]
MSTLSRIALGMAWGVVLLGFMLAVPAVASADDGFEGPSGTGAGTDPSGSKPESKLWFNDGFWWSSLWDIATSDFYIWKLDPTTNVWARTATLLDTRATTRADVLWDGTKLYVASHTFGESDGTGLARVYRFSYNATTDTYTRDSGFPQTINSVRSETLVIAKDSTGRLWATWEQGSRIWVNHTTSGDTVWATPFLLPGASAVSGDDISSIIAFGGNKIGLFWSNQSATPDADYFAIHNDADAAGTWQTPETAYSTGASVADDHINLKTTSDGRIFAAVKTSLTGSSPILVLLDRTAGGTWSAHTISTAGTGQTRPIVLVDESSSLLRVFYSSAESGGNINTKTTPLNAISFASGAGTIVIRDVDAPKINNVTSTKQNVSSSTGLVVLAFNNTTLRYWHATVFGATPPVNTTPTASATSAATAQDTPVAVPLSGGDAETCELTFSIVTAPAHGSLGSLGDSACVPGAPNADSATITYTPTAGYTGPDSFSFTTGDGTATSTSATASLTVGGDTSPPIRGQTTVNGATLTVTYDEPLDGGSVPATSAFDVQVAGSARAVSVVGVAGSTVTLSLAAPVTAGQVVTAGYVVPVAGPIQDVVGNDAAGFTAATVTNTTPVPPSETTLTFGAAADAQVKSSSATTNYGADTGLRLRSEPAPATTYNSYLRFDVSGVSGPVTAVKLRLFVTDPSPDSGTVYGTSSGWLENTITWANAPAFGTTALGGAGSTTLGTWVDVTLAPSSVSGNGSVSYALRNASTNSAIFSSKEGANPPQLLVTYSSTPPPPPDTTAPVRQSAGINAATLTLTYDEALDTASTPAAGDFAVTVGGNPRSVTNVVVSGSTVSLTVSPAVVSSDVVGISYTPGVAPIQDIVGNDALGFTAVSVTNTTTPPPPPDTTAPVRGAMAVNGSTLTIAYDETLDTGSVPAPSAYAVMVGGVARTVSNVGIAGSGVTLTLASAVLNGESVTLQYTVPGTNPVQDVPGNDAAAFGPVSVTNTTPVPTTTTTTYIATGDAQVKSTSPTTNYGSLSSMQLRQDPGTSVTYYDYLKFQVTALSGPVTAVKLRLFVLDVSPDSGSVYSSADTWAEGTITWTNAPAPAATVLGSAGATTTAGTWVEIALDPSAVTADGTYSFVLRTTSSNSTIFSSREGANPPQLLVTHGS